MISIPITYLQDLISNRPGLGSALISVNVFLNAGLSAPLFAAGTAITSYSGTAVVGAVSGLAGVAMLLLFERRLRE